MSANDTLQHINDGDDRRRVVRNGQILGWITKWYKRDAVNETGIPRFSASPVGCSVARHDCETYQSAVTYLINYADA